MQREKEKYISVIYIYLGEGVHVCLYVCVYLLKCYGYLSFPCGSSGKESACNVGDLGLIPGLVRYRGEGDSSHYSSILAWRIPWTV